MKLILKKSGPRQIQPVSCVKSLTFKEYEAALITKTYAEGYHAEKKEDGLCYLLQLRPKGSEAKNYLTSKRISKVTGTYVEKQDKVPFMRDWKVPKNLQDTVFAGEIVGGKISSDTAHEMTSGNVKYVCWDVLFISGKDVRRYELSARKAILDQCLQYMPEWFTVTEWLPVTLKTIRRIEAADDEGLILKHKESEYGQGWIKIKDEKAFDCVIWGFNKSTEGKYAKNDWIKSIKIAQWIPKTQPTNGLKVVVEQENRRLVDVGSASGFNEPLRAEISKNKLAYNGQAVQVSAQLRLKSGRLRHPRFERMRYDKSPDQCVMEL